MLMYQLLQCLLISLVGIVRVSNLCSLVVGLQLWIGVQVWVGRLMSQAFTTLSSPFDIREHRCPITTIGSILTISTIYKLLFRIVSKHPSNLFEASFNHGHVGE